jgi:hypothetical protein
MSDGAASLMSIFYSRMAAGAWRDERGATDRRRRTRYGVYETADGKHFSIERSGRFTPS